MKIPGIPFVQGRNAYDDRDSRKYGIAIHNTSNDASAEGEASYATRRTDGISAHFYVDADSVVQSLDTRARAGHAGSQEGNEHAVAVEITGVNGWTRQQWLQRVAWDRLVQVLAVVCREYDIVPRRATVAEMKKNPKVRAFYGHDDMRRAWGGTTHTDPGPNFPWDHLLAKVERALAGPAEEDEMTRDEIAAAVVVGIHEALERAAARDTATGRQIGTSINTLLAPVLAGQRTIGEAIARESSNPDEIRALLAELPAPTSADEIVAGVLAGVAPERLAEQIAAHLPADHAARVVDELAARLQGQARE
ncbi:peptidoglycan recognition protein family protein [Micromonospora echinospora]